MNAALIALVASLVIVLLFLFAAVKIAREYERGVVFRLRAPCPQSSAQDELSREILHSLIHRRLRRAGRETLRLAPEGVE